MLTNKGTAEAAWLGNLVPLLAAEASIYLISPAATGQQSHAQKPPISQLSLMENIVGKELVLVTAKPRAWELTEGSGSDFLISQK